MSRTPLPSSCNVHLSIRRGLIHFEGRDEGGRIVIREGMKRCEQPVPLSPVPAPAPPSSPPVLDATNLARSASSRAAERSDRQYLAITKYEFTFNNCGKHRRTRRVATGGESDEIRSRPRASAWDKFRFTPPPSPPPSLFCFPHALNVKHYYYRLDMLLHLTDHWSEFSASSSILVRSHPIAYPIFPSFVLTKKKDFHPSWRSVKWNVVPIILII